MQIRAITAHIDPYFRTLDLYQEYYRHSIRRACESNGIAFSEHSNTYSDGTVRKLRAVRYSYKLQKLRQHKWFLSLVDGIAGMLTRGPRLNLPPVGIYDILTDTGDTVTICIDANDSGAIFQDLAATHDLYFKSNFWPSLTYPSNVIPIANLNPLVGRDIPYFVGLRNTPKTTDLFAFFRVWGGRDEFEGIEHNLALIESLAESKCSKYLCAYLVAGDIPKLGKRLESQGIQWTTQHMPQRKLWQRAAESRLNIVRLGMHECSPWRMIDILAMGGCPIIDYGPQTRWPNPLVEGRHYLNLHLPPASLGPATLPPPSTNGWPVPNSSPASPEMPQTTSIRTWRQTNWAGTSSTSPEPFSLEPP